MVNTRRSSAHPAIFLILSALLFTGCASVPSGSNGDLKLSTSASEAFESGTVLPDHAYYYTGPEMNPNAIIAIYSDFTLETDRWKSVNATAKQLKDWVDMITDFRGYGLRTLGSDILGPHGEYIGIWYSKKSDFTTVRLLEGNRVMVFPPPAENLIIPNPLRRLGIE